MVMATKCCPEVASRSAHTRGVQLLQLTLHPVSGSQSLHKIPAACVHLLYIIPSNHIPEKQTSLQYLSFLKIRPPPIFAASYCKGPFITRKYAHPTNQNNIAAKKSNHVQSNSNPQIPCIDLEYWEFQLTSNPILLPSDCCNNWTWLASIYLHSTLMNF